MSGFACIFSLNAWQLDMPLSRAEGNPIMARRIENEINHHASHMFAVIYGIICSKGLNWKGKMAKLAIIDSGMMGSRRRSQQERP